MQKPILVLGEHWHDQEEITGQPFAGSRFFVLKSMLSDAGISLADCNFTNVFNQNLSTTRQLYVGKAESIPGYPAIETGRYFPARLAGELARLAYEMSLFQPNVIIALGPAALWATTGKTGIKKYRGTALSGRYAKVLPSWSPEQVMRQWPLRPICVSDFSKAKNESAFPDVRRPSRKIWIEPSLADIERFYHEHIVPAPALSCDIETASGYITEVGYAVSPELAIVIPFLSRKNGNYWPTFGEEKSAWNWVRLINTTKPTFGQNYQYDMQYFWKTVGIPCPHFCDDTMLLHHTLQPELEKGLGFLGSLYTNEASWKFMRHDNETLKQADE